MATATKLVATVRKALGDDTSESNQLFAMTSLSTTSLDVVRLYAAAQDAASNGKFEEARQNALEGRGARSQVRHRLPGGWRWPRGTWATCRTRRNTSTKRSATSTA